MLRTATVMLPAMIVTLIGVTDLSAQRSGFIIGFGIGPGFTSFREGSFETGEEERVSKLGLATDFKIGAQVSESVQVYYVNRVQFFGGADQDNLILHSGVDFVTTGLSGLGVTYILPTAPVHLSGAIGIAAWSQLSTGNRTTESGTGLGLTGGVGYEFADLWLLDFAVQYGTPSIDLGFGEHWDLNVLQMRAGISILSH